MSVVLNHLAAIRRFAAYQDPGLPAGSWHFRLAALGDVTGGLLSVGCRFQITGSPAPSQLWSVEQLMINSSTSAIAIPARLQIQNMDAVPEMGSTGALSDTYQVTLEPDLFAVSLQLEESPVQLFLGSPLDNNLNSGFQVDVANADGLSLSVRAQGYFWTPGAIGAPGGPRRPVDGLYAR